ncbi:hypothetical protein FJT64_003426 [Amphibalanus amphitrite]|uniref:Uncharacterized protein n=1 Tax=Amphibalanus amphitrite TaxID=1232801 RepID=A0A6A4W375_AMPAM|nr:hypothetical protein FJT64_003426 [Amphibalanus amphitrite]
MEELGLDPNGDSTEVADPKLRAQRYGMAYAAGFIAKKCSRLGARTDTITEDVADDARWIRLLSRGGLTVPTRRWLGLFSEMEATFCAVHQGQGQLRRNKQPDHLSRKPGVVRGLVARLRAVAAE